MKSSTVLFGDGECLGAALIAVAEVLRQPVESVKDPRRVAEEMVNLSARWLHRLLKPVTGSG